MEFVDAALIKIADSATRATVFDQTALEQMAAAAYDSTALALQGPYSAVFDQLELGVAISSLGSVEGNFRLPGNPTGGDLHLQFAGLGTLLPMRADALWTGSIVARTTPMQSRIATVRIRFALEDIDAAIRKDLGALPADAAALEAERRKRLLAEMRAAMSEPTLLTDAAFDAWLAGIGAENVSDLLVYHRGTLASGVLQIGFTPPAGGAPVPTTLPIAAAIMIRDKSASVAQLLMESKMLREQLSERGIAVPAVSGLPARNPFLVVWLVPIAMFDDAAWPGLGGNQNAQRTSRRNNAAAWLGPEGIVIAALAP